MESICCISTDINADTNTDKSCQAGKGGNKMNRDKVKVAQIEVCETAKKMSSSGLVAGTWGNISARVDDEYMVITPSGMI